MNNTAKNIEILKHRLASQLEASKWEYRKSELQYLEAGQHLRSLNQLMWQVPSMAIAITGGLWFGAASIEAYTPRAWVLGFTGLVNVLTIIILWRIRGVIETYINHQDNFAQTIPKSKGRVVIGCWSVALFAAGLVSSLGAYNPESISKSRTSDKLQTACNISIDLANANLTSKDLTKQQTTSPTIPKQKKKLCR